jgi:hypothetical protein
VRLASLEDIPPNESKQDASEYPHDCLHEKHGDN